MEQLVIRGKELYKVKDILTVMGGYTVVKQIIDDESLPMVHPKKAGTCSCCPHFTEIEGKRADHVLWGECSRHRANVNMYKPFCASYKAEIEIDVIKED